MSSAEVTETSASQFVSQSTPSSPTPATTQFSISPLRSSSTTQVNKVQPPTSFVLASRPNESGTLRPRPSSFTSTSSGVHQRFMDAIGGSLTRQLSIASASDVSSIAVRRMPQVVGGKHSREPLLPINAVRKIPADATVPEPPVSATSASTKKIRTSLEKIFKRGTSADSVPASLRASPRPSPLQTQFSPAELEMQQQPQPPSAANDSYFPPQPPPRPPVSRHPGFAPMPPPNATPFVPYISDKTGKPERNYVGYPSQNTFFMNGHLLTGGDSPLPFIASFVLVLGIAGTWFATTCVWWWHNESAAVALVGAYMCLVTVASMLATVSDQTLP